MREGVELTAGLTRTPKAVVQTAATTRTPRIMAVRLQAACSPPSGPRKRPTRARMADAPMMYPETLVICWMAISPVRSP